MKKSAFFLWLVSIASLCLTACGNSKDYTMTFEEVLDLSRQSPLQEVLLNTENFQQSLDISTYINDETNKLTAKLQSNSKQNLKNNKSESETTFDVNVNANDTDLAISWALDIKLVDNVIYLNLASLGLSGSEDMWFVLAMVEWFKNQRFSIPMDWLNDIPNTFSYIKEAKNLDEQTKDIVINEWSVVYNWKFSQLNGYNAYKISLDTEKLQQLINGYYLKVNEALEEEYQIEAPELNIQNFEWYFVITGKDKVTTVIENMDMIEWETAVSINGFGGENYEIHASTNWESLIVLTATKKGSNYNIYAEVSDLVILEWTITPKLSSSKIDVKFDLSLTIKSEYEEVDDTIIPLKGSWTYNSISDFEVIAPENSQNLTELLWAYLGWMMWGSEYVQDYENGTEIGENVFEWFESPIEDNTEV